MAINAYLIVKPVTGGLAFTSETVNPLFRSWPQTVVLNSFDFGSANPTTIQGAGHISFNSFTFTKDAGVNSPRFFQYCATGAHFDRVTLYITQIVGTTENIIAIYTFGTAFVMSINSNASLGDAAPTETIVLNYGQFDYHYYPYSSTGVRQTAILGSWNQTANSTWSALPLDGPLSS